MIIQPSNLADGTRSGFSTVLNIIIGLVIGAAAMYYGEDSSWIVLVVPALLTVVVGTWVFTSGRRRKV